MGATAEAADAVILSLEGLAILEEDLQSHIDGSKETISKIEDGVGRIAAYQPEIFETLYQEVLDKNLDNPKHSKDTNLHLAREYISKSDGYISRSQVDEVARLLGLTHLPIDDLLTRVNSFKLPDEKNEVRLYNASHIFSLFKKIYSIMRKYYESSEVIFQTASNSG